MTHPFILFTRWRENASFTNTPNIQGGPHSPGISATLSFRLEEGANSLWAPGPLYMRFLPPAMLLPALFFRFQFLTHSLQGEFSDAFSWVTDSPRILCFTKHLSQMQLVHSAHDYTLNSIFQAKPSVGIKDTLSIPDPECSSSPSPVPVK